MTEKQLLKQILNDKELKKLYWKDVNLKVLSPENIHQNNNKYLKALGLLLKTEGTSQKYREKILLTAWGL